MISASLSLGRIGGVRVSINWSLLALAVLVAAGLANIALPADAPGYDPFPYWIAGSITALALIVSVLLHELAHALAAKRFGFAVEGITLWFMGGLTNIEGDTTRPLQQLTISIVGPGMSAVIGAVSLLAAALFTSSTSLTAASFRWLGYINLILAAFNLLPAAPLDGGRVLHSILWWATGRRWLATRIAAGAGYVLAGICLVFGMLLIGKADRVDGISLGFMSWFLASGARGEQIAGRAQYVLGPVQIADVMRQPIAAPGWLTVSAFWDLHVVANPEAAFMLERWGAAPPVQSSVTDPQQSQPSRWSGIVTAKELASVPPDQRWTVRAQDVALPLDAPGKQPLHPQNPAVTALTRIDRPRLCLPVIAGHHTVGIVVSDDLAHLISSGKPAQNSPWAPRYNPSIG